MKSRGRVENPVRAVALLDEPRRRALYEYVVGRREPVGRDEAAKALGIGRELAAFHLDRLAAAGLLDVEYRRLGTRTGPGAGRPAKLYGRTDREAIVSLPNRDYERAAEVLAEAIDHLGSNVARAAVDDAARARGFEAGAEARAEAGADPSPSQLRAGLTRLLGDAGYEPTRALPSADSADSGATIRLGNCPFHAIVADHRELTCGMNLAWANGVLDGLGRSEAGLEAQLAPQPGYCCVTFHLRRPLADDLREIEPADRSKRRGL